MSKIGTLLVKKQDGTTDTLAWATRVSVDRKGRLHVNGPGAQHLRFDRGDWTAYVVSAIPYRLPNSLPEDS